MGFDRVTAVFAATLSHFSASSSASGSSVSSSALPPLASPFRSAWAGYGKTGGLRLSSSLQDFSTYRKVGSEEVDLALSGAGILRTKPSSIREGTGGGTSFSKDKGLPSTSLRKQCWLKVAVGFLLLLLLLILIIAGFGWLKSYRSTEASHFSIVLDCGSTGTRVYVYEWVRNDGKHQGSLPMVLRPFPEGTDGKSRQQNGRAYHRMETEPGFDKLLHNESGLRSAMEPLLQWAEKQIPAHAHKNSPLFLLATAGLRRMPSSDSEWILDKAWSILEESPFMCRRNWVRIITGVEEAYYGWVALNYMMGRLQNMPILETFGALDLGGSSLQVTFESKYGLNLTIGTMERHLNAYSLTGYGLNDAFEKSVVLLLRKNLKTDSGKFSGGQLHLNHPCIHAGYRQQYSCSQCSFLLQNGSPLVGGRDISKEESRVGLELIGEPNWEECEALAKSTINASEWSHSGAGTDCKQHPCAISDQQQQPQGQFYAMSGFFVVFKFFNLSAAASFNNVLEKGREFCTKTWQDAERSVVPQPFVEQYCFRAPYIVSLLRDGLQLKEQQVVVGSGSITWTLGILRLWRKPHLPLFGQHTSSGSPIIKIPSPFRFQGRNSIGNGISPSRSGDGRAKIPLSPSNSGCQQPFGLAQSLAGGSVQHADSLKHQSTVSVGLCFPSNLGQIQTDTGPLWTPHRGQMRLQSRRSQSREDLSLSVLESHVVKL
eukprot:PITA_04539